MRKHRTAQHSQRTAAITSKIEADNMCDTIRLLCSDDKPVPRTAKTLEEMKKKHPDAPRDCRIPCDPTENTRFDAFQVEAEDVQKTLKTFPVGSSGGPEV